MKIEANSKLVMIGDSITDCGRQHPVGEGHPTAYGNGYVNFVLGLLGAVCPQERIRVVNMGCGGHTIRDLAARWQTDVLDLKPDWVSIKIGINDVWRQFDTPLEREKFVNPEEYECTLDTLVSTTLPHVKGIVLLTPYHIEINPQDAMRKRMGQYWQLVKKIADKYNTVFVDTQAAMDKILQQHHSTYIAWDRVHPGAVGHMAIAHAFLKAIDFEW